MMFRLLYYMWIGSAQYFYSQGEQGRTKYKFNIVTFLTPIFISPLIFMPMLNIIKDILMVPESHDKIHFETMVYFLSFQQGFFWKDQFDRLRKRLPGSSGETQAQA